MDHTAAALSYELFRVCSKRKQSNALALGSGGRRRLQTCTYWRNRSGRAPRFAGFRTQRDPPCK
eukprot:6137347-Prorocentrum_lima.AAC.1